LGIAITDFSKETPDCAKSNKKGGRKSLLVLRERAGEAIDQTKITTLFNAGKGKDLPTAP